MAQGDIKIIEPKNLSTRTYQTAAATSIAAGDPVVSTTDTDAVSTAADGTPVCDTDNFVGIATSVSTDTATAVGTVEVYTFKGGEILRIKAETAANANTEAKILALANGNLLLALTGSTFTLDTTTSSALNGLRALGTGDPTTSEVDVMVKAKCTTVGSKI